MISIGIIVFLKGTYNAAQTAVRKYPPNMVEVALVGSYQEGIEASRYMVDRGAKVLISRGGYTILMREAGLSVPILDVPFTIHNFESILISARKEHSCVAIVGSPYVLETAHLFSDPKDRNTLYYEVNSVEDYKTAAFRAKNDGATVLVGGYDETRFADEAGIAKVIVSTNVDEVDAAIREAMKIVDQIEDERRRSEKLQMMFDIITEGLVLVDSNGRIVQLNCNARRIFGESGMVLGAEIGDSPLKNLIENVLSTGEAIDHELQEWNNLKYSCTIRPLFVDGQLTGALAKLQEVEYVNSMEQKIRNQLYQRGLVADYTFDDILGEDPKLLETIRKAKKYSLSDATVLIIGESGTGKELFAQSIHNYSLRKEGAFVAINCATVPSNLLESEFFGYAEGAFTGAKKGGKMGLFELAHRGTIFLDEIGEVDVQVQARLLRVLEEKRIMRLGDNRVIPVDVRVIAATNKSLYQMVKTGEFREDLFYRLNILNLSLPPLRERKGDVLVLMEHFIKIYSQKYNRQDIDITQEGMLVLLRQPWRGNARELANVIERLVIFCPKPEADAKMVTEALCIPEAVMETVLEEECKHEESDAMLRRILYECGGNKSLAAKRMGISRPTLYRRLQKMEHKL